MLTSRISFSLMNDSSRPRNVNNVQVSMPFGVTYKQCPFDVGENLQLGICRLSTGEALRIPISELLPPLVEIPSDQPCHKMFALYLQIPEPSGLSEVLPFPFVFSARKASGDKPIATDLVMILFERL